MLIGGVAQLAEHRVCNAGVRGSNPLASTILRWGMIFLNAVSRSSALELSSCGNQVLVDDTLPVRLRVEVSTLRRGGV